MTRPNLPSPKTALKLTGASLALTLLAACASSPAAGPEAAAPITSTEQWTDRVQVDSRPDEVQLAVHAEGLSANQVQAVDGLLGRWLAAEGREIVVNAPIGGKDAEAAGRMAFAVRQRLVSMGAAPAKVRVTGYDAGGAPAAPLKVGFLRFTAQIPQCGGWENVAATRDNKPYANFGCAVTANMAAQVANPEDLIRPRDTTPIDAGRRATVLDKYRKGEVTSSAKDEQSSGAISRAVN